MSSESQPAGQLTFSTLEELERWLAESAPTDSVADVACQAYRAVRKLVSYTEAASSQYTFDTLNLLRRHWRDRVSEFDEDALLEACDGIAAEYEAAAKAKAEAARRAEQAKQWKREEAERARFKRMADEDRKLRAEAVNKIAAALHCTKRHARNLYTEGTRSPERAELLAKIVGGFASHYLKDRAKPGRTANLPGYFMRASAEGCSFRDFAGDADLAEPLADALYALCHDTDNYAALDQFIAAARERKVDLLVATDVWLQFVLWRIDRLYDIATHQAREMWSGDEPPRDTRRIIIRVTED